MNQWNHHRRMIRSGINTLCLIVLSCLAPAVLSAQSYLATHYVPGSTYYNSIDTTKSTFVTDLHNLIFPHTRVTYDNYDETNVTNFASRDTTGGQRVVTCIYSGENYVYTPPFAWGTYSREHTWCQSWMPTANMSGFENRPEYSDQHHLFPVNQNKANGIRSNHPLGNVATATYTYLQCKLGTNSSGVTVFEPRASHKGDAARALLYMAVCYNGVNGYPWTFNNLNRILTDSLSEGAEDVNTLLAWSHQDPPDAWEKARNEYVDSLQGNRNPFIDHPSWVDLIDFNTLTVKTSVPLATEPANYATNFSASVQDSTTIRLTWTDAAAGTQVPSGYLLVANTSNTFSAPGDGIVYSDDAALADGSAVVNVTYGSGTSYTFSGLNLGTTYYFRLYSYNGSGSVRNYKTDGTVPSSSAATPEPTGGGGSADTVTVLAWEVNGQSSFGTQGLAASTIAVPVTNSTGLTRGSGVGTSGTAAANAWGGVSWNYSTAAAAISANVYVTFGMTIKSGYVLSLQQCAFNYRRSSTGPSNGALQYQLNGGAWTTIGDYSNLFSVTASSGGSISPISLSGISALQNLVAGTVINFRIIPYGATGATGTWYIFNLSGNDLQLTGGFDTMLPVELKSMNVQTGKSGNTLVWTTATERNNYGFDVERKMVSTQNAVWEKIGFVAGNGTSNSAHTYSFVDAARTTEAYAYRLKQIDNDGSFHYSLEAESQAMLVPAKGTLSSYPNPFNPATVVEFTVPTDGKAVVTIHNILGQEVATIFTGTVKAGNVNRAIFNGASFASGIYFAQVQAGGMLQTKKLVLMK